MKVIDWLLKDTLWYNIACGKYCGNIVKYYMRLDYDTLIAYIINKLSEFSLCFNLEIIESSSCNSSAKFVIHWAT